MREVGIEAGVAAPVDVVSVYFVASPIHYLSARRVAQDYEAGTRRILVHYRDLSPTMISREDWDEVLYIAWPRLEPLPGRFGRVRRLRENLERVAQAVGPCRELHIHSPVFEPETINYFLNGLPLLTGAREMRARLLPDGMDNLRLYPLTLGRHLVQLLRQLRRLYDRRLVYKPFRGDRMGSDAPFVDRIYVLNGFPHPYPPEKVVELAPLVVSRHADGDGGLGGRRRALVLGQPLSSSGYITEAQREQIAADIAVWLEQHGYTDVLYKAHPRETWPRELSRPHYKDLTLNEPLESHLAEHAYDAICGSSSTALVTARQILGSGCRIASFGLECMSNLDAASQERLRSLMQDYGIEVHASRR
jgi:Alpha-2,8-polysialyltransferase (POLYST)